MGSFSGIRSASVADLCPRSPVNSGAQLCSSSLDNFVQSGALPVGTGRKVGRGGEGGLGDRQTNTWPLVQRQCV